MPRHDYDIADGTGAAVLADINAVLDAINSTNRDSGTPTSAVVGTMFLDGDILKIKHGTSTNDITTIGDMTVANLGLLSATGATMTGRLRLERANQAATAPAVTFGNDTTGFFSENINSPSSIDLAVNGVKTFSMDGNGIEIVNGRKITFDNSNGDLVLQRQSTGAGQGSKTINIPHQNSTLLTQDDFGTDSAITSFNKIHQIFRENNTSTLRISGGSGAATGANIVLYGGAHSTQANRFAFYAGSTLKAFLDQNGVFFSGTTSAVGSWNSSEVVFRGQRVSDNCKAQFTTGTHPDGSARNGATDGTFIGIDSNGNSVFENAEATLMKFAVNGNTRQIITSTGKVVIGLNAAASVGDGLLQVQGASGISYASFRNTGTVSSNQIFGGFNAFSGTNDVASIFARQDGATTNARLVFSTQNSGSLTSKMIITSSGHIRFFQDDANNGDNPGFDNQVTGAALEKVTNGACLHISRADSNPVSSLNSNSTGSQFIIFRKSGTEEGSIKLQSDGSGVDFNQNSDYRLKENIVDITDGIERLKKLKPKRFNFIKAKQEHPTSYRTYDGFLAHEVVETCPEAVTGEKDGEKMQQLAPTRLITVTVAALQELIARVETLESK